MQCVQKFRLFLSQLGPQLFGAGIAVAPLWLLWDLYVPKTSISWDTRVCSSRIIQELQRKGQWESTIQPAPAVTCELGCAAAVNAESSGLVTGALGGGLALAVMIYATAGKLSYRPLPWLSADER